VIRRQVLEGVLAVVRLSRMQQMANKIPLRLFNRSLGADNVKFEGKSIQYLANITLKSPDYENLDPPVAAELVFRVKPAPLPAFSPVAPSIAYNQGISYSQTAAPPAQPDLSTLLSQFGSRPELQSLLGAFPAQGQSHSQTAPVLPSGVPHQLLAALGGHQHATYNQPGAAQPAFSLASLLGASAAIPPGSVASASVGGAVPQGVSQPDMQEIMAQLSRYQRQ
jgi:hypothetical protein